MCAYVVFGYESIGNNYNLSNQVVLGGQLVQQKASIPKHNTEYGLCDTVNIEK